MIIRFLSILIILTASISASAQNLSAENPIWLKTDRSSYISGDDAFFSLFLHEGIVNDTMPGNDIIIDITNIENQWVTGTIIKQSGGIASGMINLPDTLTTGYYLLHAYTNFPNTDNNFCSCEFFVCNRFDAEPQLVKRTQQPKASHTSTGQIINTGKTDFATHEKIDITLNCPDSVIATVRVISKKQWENEFAPVFGKVEPFSQNEGYTSLTPYDGIIVAGTVCDSVSGAPIEDAIVLISLQDSVIRLKYDITDSDGSFCVLLHNYYGLQEVFVTAFNRRMEPLRNTRIKLRNQFNFVSADLELEKSLSEIDSAELNKALIARAFEIQQFAPVGIDNRPADLLDHFVFGEPRHIVFTEDFVELNDFREITREITPFIRMRRDKNGEPELRLISDKGDVMASPLLLVDGVPLTDLNKLINKGSTVIKRVDTQNKPRHFGNISFSNGIVAVWTHKIDFWEKCNAAGTYRFMVQGFQPPVAPAEVKPSKDKTPDLRQTIYWNPLVNTAEQKNISVTMSDETGEFVIEFFGVGRDGKIVSDFKQINVK